jgi:hypothetical protein
MQNETYVNKRLLRYFENTNRQIVEHAGFLSFRIWFLVSVMILVFVGNGLMLFFSMPAAPALPISTKATPISFDMDRSTAASNRKHVSPIQHNISVSLPGLQPPYSAKLLPKGEKDVDICSDSSSGTSCC